MVELGFQDGRVEGEVFEIRASCRSHSISTTSIKLSYTPCTNVIVRFLQRSRVRAQTLELSRFLAWETLGLMEEAKDAFLVALSLKPMNVALQNNIANLCLMIGDTSQAIVRYKSILSIDPELVDIWLNLGVVFASSGRAAEARQAWNKGLEYDSNNQTLKGYLKTLNQ